MKRIGVLFLAATALGASGGQAGLDTFDGSWDLTIKTANETYPSWVEVSGTLREPNVRIVGRVSSVHPASDVKLDGTHLSFRSSEWFGKSMNIVWNIAIADDRITGTQRRPDGTEGQIVGVRAPVLNRQPPAHWSSPERLFDGKSLSGWIADQPDKNHWQAQSGALVNAAPGSNLRTVRAFQDFKLHLEFKCPEKGNSGVFLRGRYEVQIENEPVGSDDAFQGIGAIYGFLAPAVKLPRRPGQWESFDITLVGRTVTVVRDGTVLIDEKEIPGITGGALNSHEAEPGPVYLQGDHTGGVEYRNILVSVR